MIESVARTFANPHLQFVEMKLGLYPAAYSREQEPVSQGSPINWGLEEIDVRVVRVVDATGESHRLRMHEVAMDPGFVKLDWVSPTATATVRTGLQGDRRDLGSAGRLDRGPGRRARQLLPRRSTSTRRARSTCSDSVQHVSPDAWRTTSTRSPARSPGSHRRTRELRQGRQAALQHHPDPAARRRCVVPATALRRPAGAALPGQQHHARAQRGHPRRPARPRDDPAGRSRPSRAPSPTATPARTARRSWPWSGGSPRWTGRS